MCFGSCRDIPGNFEKVGCVSEAIETFPGDLEGPRCVSEVIETFPGDFNFPLDVFAIEDAIASLDERVNWLVVNAASILIIAN